INHCVTVKAWRIAFLCLCGLWEAFYVPHTGFTHTYREEGEGFLSVNIGENITLECSYEDQNLNNPRFELDTKNKNHHLMIFKLQFSDSATYHCISTDSYSIKFLKSYSVHVKDASFYFQTSVDQSSSENIHAGDSVTLNCTVHTGSCDGEHRVYWFKDSEDSHPGLIYTHGGRNDQCERKKNTRTHSCVYELSMKNLTESDSGIYYCAVVSCGHIMFGNGTKLDLTGEDFLYLLSFVLIYSPLSAPLVFVFSPLFHSSISNFLPSYLSLKNKQRKAEKIEDRSSNIAKFKGCLLK
uniref:Ig-like domain-containing protein n=1 Tax=Oryzias melastigma TaxID=30732 RepID=A0A3B3CIE1_ORYME